MENFDRRKKHKQERILAWAASLAVAGLLIAGLVFAVIKLKAPVATAIKKALPSPAAQTTGEIKEQEAEAEPDKKQEALDEESLSAIFDDKTEDEAEDKEEKGTDAIFEEARVSADELVDGMTIEQMAAQLFFVTPESITGVDAATAAGEKTRLALEAYPVGGLLFSGQNIENPGQIKEMTAKLKRFSDESVSVPIFLALSDRGRSLEELDAGTSDEPGETDETEATDEAKAGTADTDGSETADADTDETEGETGSGMGNL